MSIEYHLAVGSVYAESAPTSASMCVHSRSTPCFDGALEHPTRGAALPTYYMLFSSRLV